MTEDRSWFAAREHRAAFAIGDQARSWGDFLTDAGRLARWIRSAVPQENASSPPELMVACGDRYYCAVSLLAIWSAGGVAALPPHGRPESVDALCGERKIRWILHDGGGEGGLDVRTVLSNELPLEGAAGPPPADLSLAWRAEQPLVSLYTSGSTGAHVACTKTAGQLLGEARLLVELFELGAGTRVLATVPPHHIYGLLFGVLVPLVGGGAFVRITPHHGETIAAHAARWRADVLCSVPAHLRGLTSVGKGGFPSLRRIFSSGAPLPPDIATELDVLSGGPVLEILGSSETGGIAWRQRGAPRDQTGLPAPVPVGLHQAAPLGQRSNAVGAAAPTHLSAAELSAAQRPAEPWWRPFPGITVTADEEGVMLLRSPFVAPTGPGDSGDAWTSAPYRAAGRVTLGPDGCFSLLGRADGILKIGGNRVSLAEVERLLAEIPGVHDAAVIAVDVASSRRHELWAVVATDTLDVPALRAALLRQLEPIAIPRRFRLVSALPREQTGKLTRTRLHALFGGDHPSHQIATASAGQTTEQRSDETSDARPRSPAVLSSTRSAHGDAYQFPLTVGPESPLHPFFEGHFQNFPVLPGVVQLNNIVLHAIHARWPMLRRLDRVLSLKFRRPIRPGERLLVQLTRSSAVRVTFQIRRADEVVSSGTLQFSDATKCA